MSPYEFTKYARFVKLTPKKKKTPLLVICECFKIDYSTMYEQSLYDLLKMNVMSF